MEAAYAGEEQQIRTLVERVVPTYHPAGEHGAERKDAAYEKQIELAEHQSSQTEARLAAV